MNNINPKNNLAVLAWKENQIKISLAVSSQIDDSKWQIKLIIDYTPEEKLEIDSFMKNVHEIDDLIANWKPFANSLEYGMFVWWYSELSPRVQKHFDEIYYDLRLKYLVEKISKNLVNIGWPINALSNYFTELQKNYPNFDLKIFYTTFPNSKNLLDKILKKEA